MSLRSDLSELFKYRHLLGRMFISHWQIRYRSSTSAFAFSIVAPLIQVLVMTVAIEYFLNAGPRNLSAFIMCGAIPFTFFQASLMSAFTGIDTIQPIVKRLYFPREILIIVYVTINFVQMIISLFVFLLYRYVVLVPFFGWPGAPPHEVFLVPALMLLVYILTLGTAFFTSAVFFYFEDVRFLINFGTNLMFYLVPILYYAENIFYATKIHSARLRYLAYHIYLANPLAWIVTAFKQVFFGRQIISQRGATILLSAPFDYRYFALNTLFSILILVFGYMFFNQMKWKFAERP